MLEMVRSPFSHLGWNVCVGWFMTELLLFHCM